MSKISRRKVVKASVAAAGLVATGCASKVLQSSSREPSSDLMEMNVYDFIIVGSGAGGGPLAIRLAQAGFHVLLLEAGGDKHSGYSTVPVMHGKASDDPMINWGFFVQRYAPQMRQYDMANSKYIPKQANGYGGGVYYPRGTGLGGCTQMNALIHLYPDEADWENIAQLTGDSSWSPSAMYQHYLRLQSFRADEKIAGGLREYLNDAVATFKDKRFEEPWLNLEQAPISLLADRTLRAFVLASLKEQGIADEALDKIEQGINIKLNPNTPKYIKDKEDGLFSIPFNTRNGQRYGVRETLLAMEASKRYPNLVIKRHALCKKVIFSESEPNKVEGVEYSIGQKLYKASSAGAGVYQLPNGQIQMDGLIAKARREVIIAGGAFNSPQLLMLSGIGDPQHLESMGIRPRVALPGVGRNLQDRYEVCVITKLRESIQITKDCHWMAESDKCFADWKANARGTVYSTNGAVISNLIRSDASKKSPDLNIFGLPGFFKGYYPNWSKDAYNAPDQFSWAVLKGHTNNVSGWVRLKSADFQDTPEINFNYFNSESDPRMEDLTAVVNGVKKARAINNRLPKGFALDEIWPGKAVDTDEEIKDFIMKESWGHHASCSNKMGSPNDPMAVVDSQFRVLKTQGLRIVDASVFPRIPGLFLALPTMMISEKAAQLIISQYRRG